MKLVCYHFLAAAAGCGLALTAWAKPPAASATGSASANKSDQAANASVAAAQAGVIAADDATLEISAGDDPVEGVQRRLEAVVKRRDEARPGQNLLIASSEMDPSTARALQEDLTVMSRILEKSLNQHADEAEEKAMGISVVYAGGSGGPRTLYLQDYGALFFVNARFPLVAPSAKKEEPKPDRPTNSAWEQARDEIYGSAEGANRGGPSTKMRRLKAAEPYSAEKVETLTSDILQALKNASNIRQLKPESYITVVVSSSQRGSELFKTVFDKNVHVFDGFGGFNLEDGRQSHLTIRVKKADADAFAKDKLSSEEFRKRASIQAYYASSGANPAFLWQGFGR